MDDLRALVLSRHKSVHAFLRHHPELNRSTVYQVLGGRYGGNVQAQQRRIMAALDGTLPIPARAAVPCASELAGVLQAAKCGNCRRLDKRGCLECRTQTEHEAKAMSKYLEERCDA